MSLMLPTFIIVIVIVHQPLLLLLCTNQAQNNKSVDGEPAEAVLVPMNLEFVKVFIFDHFI